MASAAQKLIKLITVLQYKIYGFIRHREYELQASSIEEIKQHC